MSLLAARCEQVREQVTIDALLEVMGVEAPSRGRIRCLWPDHEDRSPSMQIYRETNSVHCFACNQGGDVVELARRAGNPDGGEWSLEDALDWLEETFGLRKLTVAQTLQGRLRKQLSKRQNNAGVPSLTAGNVLSRNTMTAAQRGAYDTIVRSAFCEAERNTTPDQRAAVMDIREYIWSEADRPGVDLMAWAAWARRMIFGSYAKLMGNMTFPDPPSDVVDDRPETCRRAQLWELHRGAEYPSSWHLQLL
jgi:hypothetical protein